MKHRMIKSILTSISGMSLFDTRYWNRGALLIMYGMKHPDEPKRHRVEILMINYEGLYLYNIYSWDARDLGCDVVRDKLKITGIDIV